MDDDTDEDAFFEDFFDNLIFSAIGRMADRSSGTEEYTDSELTGDDTDEDACYEEARKKQRKQQQDEDNNGDAIATGKQVIDPPAHIVELILNRLSLPEVIPFKRVSKSWRATILSHSPEEPRAPWRWVSNTRSMTKFHDLVTLSRRASEYGYERVSINIKVPGCLGPRGAKCIGSSHGWLVLKGSQGKVILWNPMSNQRRDLPIRQGWRDDYSPNVFSSSWHIKFLYMSSSPAVPTAMLLMTDGTKDLLLWRPGQVVWTVLLREWRWSEEVPHVATHFDGGKQLLLLDKSGCIWIIDSRRHSLTKLVQRWASPNELADFDDLLLSQRKRIPGVYMTRLSSNSDDGAVFVVRFKRCIRGTCVSVRRFEPVAMEWVDIDDLGDQAMFLSETGSVLVPVVGQARFRANCIYFNSMVEGSFWVFEMGRERARGCYSREQFPYEADEFWFTPSLA